MALLQQGGGVLHEIRRVIPPDPSTLVRPLRVAKKEALQHIIESALILCEGNRQKAAERLEISRRMLRYHMRRNRRDQ